MVCACNDLVNIGELPWKACLGQNDVAWGGGNVTCWSSVVT